MERKRKPDWLKIKYHINNNSKEVDEILKSLNIHTVCEEALCPNRGECFSKRTATFMILGTNCTRHCAFCNVSKNSPDLVDELEPEHIKTAVDKLNLKHVVITSVTRDDLGDGGALHFAKCIKEIKTLKKDVSIEVLIPDFVGSYNDLKTVVDANPLILNHNIETIGRLYPTVRPEANYKRSLGVLKNTKKINPNMLTKSGIMVGLGEKFEEVVKTLEDLRLVDCDFLTIGQYLAPSKKHHDVIEYIHPDVFDKYKTKAEKLGFKYVASAPFVRSSYNALEAVEASKD